MAWSEKRRHRGETRRKSDHQFIMNHQEHMNVCCQLLCFVSVVCCCFVVCVVLFLL